MENSIILVMVIFGMFSLALGVSYFIINCGEDDNDIEINRTHEWDDDRVHTEGEI